MMRNYTWKEKILTNESIRFALLLLAVCGGLLFALAVAYFGLNQVEMMWKDTTSHSPKLYRRTLAEGVQIRNNGMYGIDLIRCGACRVEKLRKGPITFGALNVLVMEDLYLVLPLKEAQNDISMIKNGDVSIKGRGTLDCREIVRRLGVSDVFLSSRGIPVKFSGLRIKGLQVNRLSNDSRSAEPLFSAKRAEAVKGGLSLWECVVFKDGGKGVPVGKAFLVKSKKSLHLKWRDGEMIF